MTATTLLHPKFRAYLLKGLTFLGLALAVTAFAQSTPDARPVPAAWQSLGLSKWPEPSPHLGLKFDDIVLPGPVPIHLRSNVQFTQKLILYAYPPGAPASMTELASFGLSSKTAAETTLSIRVTTTQNMVLLAQTPSGWMMAERQLKVGHKP